MLLQDQDKYTAIARKAIFPLERPQLLGGRKHV